MLPSENLGGLKWPRLQRGPHPEWNRSVQNAAKRQGTKRCTWWRRPHPHGLGLHRSQGPGAFDRRCGERVRATKVSGSGKAACTKQSRRLQQVPAPSGRS